LKGPDGKKALMRLIILLGGARVEDGDVIGTYRRK
jgi:hypothetical protein